MGKFNTYRYLVLKDPEEMGRKYRRTRKANGKLHRLFLMFILVTIFLILGIYTSLLNPIVEHIASKLGISETMYAVVVDSDASKSDLYVYKFHKSLIGGNLVLDDEVVHQNKPGLTSYLYNPNKGKYLLDLLKQLCNVIPFDHNYLTPLLYRATSIPENLSVSNCKKVDEMIEEYFNYVVSIKTLPFTIIRDYFRVLKKQEEQINLWTAVNVLEHESKSTYAVLDVDDNFAHLTTETKEVGAMNTVRIKGPNERNLSIFTNSYSNMGLMAVRFGVIIGENPENTTHLTSQCLNPLIKDKYWKYGDLDLFVSGSQKDIKYINVKETERTVSDRIPVVRMDRCRDLILKYVRNRLELLPVPKISPGQDLSVFGHFFDKSAEAGLVDPIIGGSITMAELLSALNGECINSNVDQPWICFDLTYISILLEDILHVDIKTKLKFFKKINSHKVHWALGLAYRTLADLTEVSVR